jgi:hypothetical protein
MPGVFKVTAQANITGPIGDGRADRALQDWSVNVAAALGKEGVDLLRAFPMNKTGRAHGGFQANLNVLQQGPVARIKGPMIKGVVWSPWLEGTSKRNQSTRFKGYHLFRLTRQKLQERAPQIGQDELDKVMPRIGGT